MVIDLAVNVLVAVVLASSLATSAIEAPPVPPTPPADPTDPTAGGVPEPTIPPPTSSAGTPKRVTGLPGSDSTVAKPKPIAPTPIAPTPVEPVGPKPIIGGGDQPTKIVPDKPDPEPRRRKPRRDRTAKVGTDNGAADTGACLAPQARCRTFVIAGSALAAGGLGIGIGGVLLISRRPTPVLEEPTRVETFRPPGIAMAVVGGGLLIGGIAVLAAGIAAHRRDQSMRRTAWWRPVFQVGAFRL